LIGESKLDDPEAGVPSLLEGHGGTEQLWEALFGPPPNKSKLQAKSLLSQLGTLMESLHKVDVSETALYYAYMVSFGSPPDGQVQLDKNSLRFLAVAYMILSDMNKVLETEGKKIREEMPVISRSEFIDGMVDYRILTREEAVDRWKECDTMSIGGVDFLTLCQYYVTMRVAKWPSVVVPKMVALRNKHKKVKSKAARAKKTNIVAGPTTTKVHSSKTVAAKKTTKAKKTSSKTSVKTATKTVGGITTKTETTTKTDGATGKAVTTITTTAIKDGKVIEKKSKRTVTGGKGEKAKSKSRSKAKTAVASRFKAIEEDVLGVVKDPLMLAELWNAIDTNQDGRLDLQEVQNMVVGTLPERFPTSQIAAFGKLKNQAALKGAYKHSFSSQTQGRSVSENWVEPNEFAQLLVNIYYFNKVYQCYEQSTDDVGRRITETEFTEGLANIGLDLGEGGAAKAEFDQMDSNDGGSVLFDDFCVWCTAKLSPAAEIAESSAKFVASKAPKKRPSKMASLFKRSPKKAQGGDDNGNAAIEEEGATPSALFTATAEEPKEAGTSVPRRPSQKKVPARKSVTSPQQRSSYAQVKKKNPKRAFSNFEKIEAEVLGRAKESSGAAELWDVVDVNDNALVGLAEIEKLLAEKYPVLSNTSALHRAYTQATSKPAGEDAVVETKEFMSVLANAFFFNKAYQAFDQGSVLSASGATAKDRRVDEAEFVAGVAKLGVSKGEAADKEAFGKIPSNAGGKVDFWFVCDWYIEQVVPAKEIAAAATGFVKDQKKRKAIQIKAKKKTAKMAKKNKSPSPKKGAKTAPATSPEPKSITLND